MQAKSATTLSGLGSILICVSLTKYKVWYALFHLIENFLLGYISPYFSIYLYPHLPLAELFMAFTNGSALILETWHAELNFILLLYFLFF